MREVNDQKGSVEMQLEEIRIEMDQLTKVDKRTGTLKDLAETFDNISTFINGIEDHQAKTVLTMKKLEYLMNSEKG